MEKIIRVDMNNLEITEENSPFEYDRWGGRGLTSKIICDEVDPGCDPLGSLNKLVIAPGLLGGSRMLTSSNRLSIGGKSPLTGGIKESNAGGTFALRLSQRGIKGIIVEGKAKGSIYILKIGNSKTELLQMKEITGLGNYQLAERLRSLFGHNISFLSVGQAGERGLLAAGIAVSDMDGFPSRFAARGGLGAVLGSKGLKCIVIEKSENQKPDIKDPELFKAFTKDFNRIVNENPVTAALREYSTAIAVSTINTLGALPTHNFRMGQFDKVDSISGQYLHEIIKQRNGQGRTTHACMPGCLVQCSNVYPDHTGAPIVGPLEYETIGMMGSNCGIGNLDEIARMNYLCNNYGLDTIEIGATLAIAMEAGILNFGDSQRAIELIDDIGQGKTFLGRILGSGVSLAGQVLGVRRVPCSRGQAFPAYDPRALKGMGVLYATCTMGADHTLGQTVRAPIDQKKAEGQVPLSKGLQIVNTLFDILGLCLFLKGSIASEEVLVTQLLQSKTGLTMEYDEWLSLSKKLITMEKEFNEKAGLNFGRNLLPEFLRREKLPPFDVLFDVPQDEIDGFYKDF